MTVTSEHGEVEALRREFAAHEHRDQERFAEVRQDLKEHGKEIGDLQKQFANAMGRFTVIGVIAILLIPVLTELVRANFDHSNAAHNEKSLVESSRPASSSGNR